MYTVELYARVRRAVQVEGKSERQVAREYGLARETVRKMLQYAAPPGYHSANDTTVIRFEARVALGANY
ncbi:MAG: hypothetical protein HYX72_07290 [Acidobacteria bacterium]|nr:hypothetical protein [Acidobacteriota bacterium]